jgi:multidrug resistance efflux pump
MTWANRMRLVVGLIVVVAVVAAATLILSQRQTETASTTASIKAISYSIGSDYAGTVTDAKVKVGQSVRAGQPLLVIQSASLARDQKSKTTVPTNSAYRVGPGGVVTLLATEPGFVSNVGASVGGFVAAGAPLATIDRSGSLYVLATFHLDPYDFSRIDNGAEVGLTLPNQQLLVGQVSQINVTTESGSADASIKVRSSELRRGSYSGLVEPGTPISAILHLRDDGPLAGVKETFLSLVRQSGL